MFTATYLHEQSAKFHQLAAAARLSAQQEEYDALSTAYESLARLLAQEAIKAAPKPAQTAA